MEKKSVVIIGSGPAGYTAGIYTGRARLETTLFSGVKLGGQLMLTTDIENFPGFKDGIAGPKLMMEMRAQAARFDVAMRDQFVTAVDFSQRPFKIWTTFPAGKSYEDMERADAQERTALLAAIKTMPHTLEAESVIIASGAVSTMLGVEGEQALIGRGVSTCAVCDAAFYRGKKTFVVGGGDSAMEDALALTKFADSVTMIHRRDSFRASKIMQERVLAHPKISVLWNSSVAAIVGTKKLEQVVIETKAADGSVTKNAHDADGVFLAIGHQPMTHFLGSEVLLDPQGYIVTRMSLSAAGVAAAQSALHQSSVAYPTMTSVEGVFAAGDVVDIRYRQAITAAGQGCSAAIDAERWLETQA